MHFRTIRLIGQWDLAYELTRKVGAIWGVDNIWSLMYLDIEDIGPRLCYPASWTYVRDWSEESRDVAWQVGSDWFYERTEFYLQEVWRHSK